MTKLKTNIKNAEKVETESKRKGAYLAQFYEQDDRILFFNGGYGCGSSKISVIALNSHSNELYIQTGQDPSNYTNLKKIKKITIEVEL